MGEKTEDGTEVTFSDTVYIEDDGSDLELTDADLGPTDQSDQAADRSDDGTGDDGDTDQGDAGDDGAYKPDYSYKVYDEEREIPEEMRGLITDKESEDRIRSIMARADGLEGMKAKNEKIRTERDEARQQLDDYGQRFNEAEIERERVEYYRRNDLGLFLRHHGVSDKDVFDYANQVYDAEKDPNLRGQMSERQRRIHDDFQQRVQNHQTLKSATASSYNVHQQALDMAMQDPSVADIAARWDSRVEVPGDFLQKVEDYGNSVYRKTGKNITPFEAVRYVADTYSKVLTPEPDAGNGGGRSPAKRKSTIPTVGTGGGGRSPTKKRPRDIDEFDAMVESGSY